MVLTTGGVQFSDGQAGSFIDNNGYALAINMAMPFMVISGSLLRCRSRSEVHPSWASTRPCPSACSPSSAPTPGAGCSRSRPWRSCCALLQRRRFTWLAGMVLAGVLDLQLRADAGRLSGSRQTISTYEEVGEGSALGRLHFWRIAFKMVAANPFGVGLRNYDRAYNDYDDSGGVYGLRRSVHNSHLQMLVGARAMSGSCCGSHLCLRHHVVFAHQVRRRGALGAQ